MELNAVIYRSNLPGLLVLININQYVKFVFVGLNPGFATLLGDLFQSLGPKRDDFFVFFSEF